MDDLIIHKTESTPEIDFKGSGRLTIKGKSLPEDPKKFFGPIFNWVNSINAKEIEIDVKLDYVSTSSSKRIFELIKAIDTSEKVREVKLNWYYEVDDADMLEFGEMIQRNLKRTKTKYIECDDLDF